MTDDEKKIKALESENRRLRHVLGRVTNAINGILGTTGDAYESIGNIRALVAENGALRVACARQWGGKTPNVKTCEECGTVFESKRSDAKLCSTKCRNRRHKAKREAQKGNKK